MRVQGVENSFSPLQQDVKAKPVIQESQGAGLPEVKAQDADKTEENNKQAWQKPGDLEKAVEQANQTMETYGTELRFSIHKESGEMMVKVINTKDNSVIREIPPERVLDMVAHVKKMLGILIDKFI